MKRLKDGFVISIGQKKSSIIDIQTHDEYPLTIHDLASIQTLALGGEIQNEVLLEELEAQGVLAEGPASVDSVIQNKLSELDSLFSESYFSELSDREKSAHELILLAHSRRKQFYAMVGQCPILPETALRRALHVGDAQKVGKKRIVCVGDDDLVSIGLAALGHDVVSCDIDDYLLSFIEQFAQEFDLNLTTLELDLRDPLPKDLVESFDVFLTDPMSNKECFELFLSRALAMLAPHGRGFTAVYGPTTQLFSDFAKEIHLDIVHWHRRHNRYYTHFIKQHRYESDWLEIRKSPQTKLPYSPEEFASPLQLYREEYFQRPIALFEFIDHLENTRFAKPLYLDMLLDGMLEITETKEIERHWHYAQDWTGVHIHTREGYIALHVDRKNAQIMLSNYPFTAEIEEALRWLLLNGYKRQANRAYSAANQDFWDIRIN